MDKYSIDIVYFWDDGKVEKKYTGKVINGTYYRNFASAKSTLWSDGQFGVNVEILDHLVKTGVKWIMYIDTSKPNTASRLSVKRFNELKEVKEFAYGAQAFVKKGAFNRVKDVPRLPYISKSIIIQCDSAGGSPTATK